MAMVTTMVTTSSPVVGWSHRRFDVAKPISGGSRGSDSQDPGAWRWRCMVPWSLPLGRVELGMAAWPRSRCWVRWLSDANWWDPNPSLDRGKLRPSVYWWAQHWNSQRWMIYPMPPNYNFLGLGEEQSVGFGYLEWVCFGVDCHVRYFGQLKIIFTLVCSLWILAEPLLLVVPKW